MVEKRLYCTFFIGRQFYGIAVEDVQEVLLSQHLAGVPLAPPAVAGLMNLRGQIVTAIDVRTVLGTEADLPADHVPINLVVRHEGAEVSLLVDRIGDVIDVAGTPLERPPETLQQAMRHFLTGIYALEHSLLLVLDVHRMLEDDRCMRSVAEQTQ